MPEAIRVGDSKLLKNLSSTGTVHDRVDHENDHYDNYNVEQSPEKIGR